MSLAENLQTVENYDFSRVANLEQALGFVDSLHKETNRKPDEFKYWIDKGGLVDPATNLYLHETLDPDLHPIPYLGHVESGVIQRMDKLAIENEEGFIFWLSPSYEVPGGYPGHKLEILKISKSPANQKQTENEVICFDCSASELIGIAGNLFEEFRGVADTETIRKSVIYRKNTDIDRIKISISMHIDANEDYKIMSNEDRFYVARLMIGGASSKFIAMEMERLGILGQHSISCPSSSTLQNSLSEILIANSLMTEVQGWHHGVCRVCHLATWVGPCEICKPCESKV